MLDDAELLRRYVEDRTEDAFTELVHRHLGLVYSTALRRVGHDMQLAEDVAQKVFTDLARKAVSLRGHATLSGWLYVSAHVASAAVVRSEQRRKIRETEAQIMQTLLSDSSTPDWRHLRPVLDEAIVSLRNDEREAIALRFFERRSFAEIGTALRLTEEAARKRVERALEKLRAVLARRDITSTTAMLALALGELAPGVTPAGLATKIAGHAFKQGMTAGVGSSLTALLGSGLAIGAAFVAGAWAVNYQYHVNRQLAAELAWLRSEPHAIEIVRTDNRRLARTLLETDELRRLAAELPKMRAELAPTLAGSAMRAPTRATVTVEADGRMRWGAEFVTLADFNARLKALQANSSDGEVKIGIRGFSDFSALAYAIDEVRKAGIKHVVVESNATPDPKFGFSWF